MFIIFGWGKETIRDHGVVRKLKCKQCNNEEEWHLYSKKTWITLFFIPVIPYSFENYIVCPICRYGIKVEGEQLEECKEIVRKNRLASLPGNNEEHLEERNSSAGSDRYDGRSTLFDIEDEDNKPVKKTPTQLNYIQQMKEIEQEREIRAVQAKAAQRIAEAPDEK